MPLINCKIHLELNWNNNCVIYGADTYAGGNINNDREATFQITSTKLYVPVVTLSTKENVNLTQQLDEGFKRLGYWKEYQSKIETKDALFQDVNRLFVLAVNNTAQNVAGNPSNNTANRVQRDSHRKYFLPRVNITNYNVLSDGRNFYDQPINGQIKKYDEIRKIATGKGDNYTTGRLLDYQYFKDHYQLIAVDLSK